MISRIWIPILSSLAITVLAAHAMAGRSVSYYDGINATTSATARATAGSIIRSGTRTIGYTNTWPRIYRTDEDPNNVSNVILVYGGQSRVKAQGGTADNSNSTGGWNREHAWPQGNYNQAEPMRSDLHALFPADVDANTDRSDQDFSTVSSPFASGYPDVFGNRDNNVHWEPAAESKGKIARAMLYMDVRYEATGSEPNLILQENGAGPDSLRMGRRSVLLQWHRDFKPTAFEIARSAKVFEEQGNSNPFIDRPEQAAVIFPDGPAWSPGQGTTITVAATNRAPVASQAPSATNIPLLSIALSMVEQQDFHLNGMTLTKLGSLPDSMVLQMKLWFDVDHSGTVTSPDILLTTGSLTSGTWNPDLVSRPFRLGQGRLDLLVAADLSAVISGGPHNLGIRLEANSITHDPAGGNDSNPTFSQQDSGLVPISGNVSNGDTLSLTNTTLAPISALRGLPAVPMIRILATPSAGEFDLASLALTRGGTATDGDVPSVSLFLDTNNNSLLDGPDQELGTSAFSTGATTITLAVPLRFSASTARSLILSVPLSGNAVLDRTFSLTLVPNSLTHDVSGGVDVSGTNAGFTSDVSTIIATQASTGASLIVSEVYEGTAGSLKYVELRNVSTGTLSLNGIQLRRYSNASLTFTGINLTSTTLVPGGYYLVANNATDMSTFFPAATVNQVSGSISHNGDDCYTLFDTISGTVLDGFASDNVGTTGNFAANIVAFRIESELPNDGSWGGVIQATANQDSPSGFWQTRVVTSGNGNAATVGSPGAPGLPVALSDFEIE